MTKILVGLGLIAGTVFVIYVLLLAWLRLMFQAIVVILDSAGRPHE